jgi:hypothetical protein
MNGGRERAQNGRHYGTMSVDDFTQAYIECALWASNDEHGEPLDSRFGLSEEAKR